MVCRRTTYHSCYSVVIFLIVTLVMSGCSSHKHLAKHQHVDAQTYIKGRKLNKIQKKMIEEACSWAGTPYKYGGAEKNKGTDCSGFVLRVYLDVTSIKLPRNSAAQAEFCKKIKLKKVKPCDLVFFATGHDTSKVSHVGLMLDDENFIHASSSKGVIITRLDNPWWNKRIICFGHVPGF